jgi:hypothetical protein
MSDTDIFQIPTPDVQTFPKKPIPSLEDARSYRQIDSVVQRLASYTSLALPSREEIRRRRQEVQRLLDKTRKVAWIWANVYGYGDDHLFPRCLYDPDAAYLAVVQAGVILVLDSERRRVACFVSDDGCTWNRYSIRRNVPLNNPSLYVCRIKHFPNTSA